MKTLFTAILGITLTTAALVATEGHSAADTRSYTAGRFAFGIDGQFAGFIKSISGGTIKGEVGTRDPEPLTLETNPSMGQPMFEWIKASFDKGIVPHTIDLRLADADGSVTKARRLDHSRIASVTVPALDGSSKDPGYFTVKIDPQTIRYKKAAGTIEGAEGTASKKWLCSNFRLEIDGLPTSRVSKIDSFSWEHTVIRDETGKFSKASTPKISNLRLTISMADYDAWAQWHKSFVIDGKSGEDREKAGSLTFLGPDHKAELMSIELSHLGIISLEQAALTDKAPAQFEVTLAVKGLHLSR